MALPKDNLEGYRSASVLSHVGNLKGQLMLVHGMIDENVHFRHTARLIDQLSKKNLPYTLIAFPDERHMPRGFAERLALEGRIVDFFQQNL
jgi:dipeptidyl-peptidase-4